jgi:hypothetical protein
VRPRFVAAMFFAAFAALAAVALVASSLAHVASLLGARLPMRAVLALHVGVFVVWMPFVISTLVLRATKSEVKAYPGWWRGGFRWLLAYVGLHFALAVVTMIMTPNGPPDPGGVPAFVGRLFSAVWIFFYATATIGFDAFRATMMREA